MEAEKQRVELVASEGTQASLIALRGSVDVTVASQLLDMARQVAGGQDDVIVDGEGVERFDLSAVQILLALRRAMVAGRRFRLAQISSAGRRFIELSGTAAELLPDEPPASVAAPWSEENDAPGVGEPSNLDALAAPSAEEGAESMDAAEPVAAVDVALEDAAMVNAAVESVAALGATADVAAEAGEPAQVASEDGSSEEDLGARQ